MILGILLAADMWLCDPHGICVYGHDWVGLGPITEWPKSKKRHEKADAGTHKPCRLGDKNWKNDCK